MEHILNEDFWGFCAKLPRDVQRRIPQKFELLRQNPRHPSLHFKKVGDHWSIRICKGYRAVARRENNTFVWFWAGKHDEYMRRIRQN